MLRHRPVCVAIVLSLSLVLGIACVFAAEPDAPAPPAVTGLAQRFAASRSAITAFSCDFTRTVAGDPPSVLRGHLEAQVAGADRKLRYRLELTDPVDPVWMEAWYCDGATSWHLQRTLADVPPDVTSRPAGADDGDLRRLAALLRGDLTALAEDFSISEAAERSRLVLTAKSDTNPVARIEAELKPDGSSLTQVDLEDRQGKRSSHRIDRLEDNPVLAPERFRPIGR
ncbi:hypothetical protein LBMAG53_27220 [Planctomycetota bacterium]|nr:hypothetical protein LBMAG53_27220 [Planctomycetota bacterium]